MRKFLISLAIVFAAKELFAQGMVEGNNGTASFFTVTNSQNGTFLFTNDTSVSCRLYNPGTNSFIWSYGTNVATGTVVVAGVTNTTYAGEELAPKAAVVLWDKIRNKSVAVSAVATNGIVGRAVTQRIF